jgi:hypothetical protein
MVIASRSFLPGFARSVLWALFCETILQLKAAPVRQEVTQPPQWRNTLRTISYAASGTSGCVSSTSLQKEEAGSTAAMPFWPRRSVFSAPTHAI